MAPKTSNFHFSILKTFKIIGFHQIQSKKNSIPQMCNSPLSDVLNNILVTATSFIHQISVTIGEVYFLTRPSLAHSCSSNWLTRGGKGGEKTFNYLLCMKAMSTSSLDY